MRNLVYTTATLTNDADGICASQSAAGAQALLINGALVTSGVASWTDPQKVTITSAGNDTAVTFTITGADPDGKSISSTLVGSNASTATTTQYYKTVTGITTSAATGGAVTIGPLSTNGAVSKSLRVDSKQMDFGLGLFADVISGTLTYTIQYAYQEPEATYTNSFATDADWRSVDGLTALAADGTSNIAYPVNCVRILISAYTSGTLRLTVTQGF